MTPVIDDKALDQLFRTARSHNGWKDTPVSDVQLRALYDLMKWGPTTSNSQPQRILFLRTQKEKERLQPAMSASNQEKTIAAPVVAILVYDLKFYEHLRRFYPQGSASYLERLSRIRLSPNRSPSATRRCRAAISSSPRAR